MQEFQKEYALWRWPPESYKVISKQFISTFVMYIFMGMARES